MAFVALSDIGRNFLNQKANINIREQLAIKSQEIANGGQSADLALQAGPSYGRWQEVTYRLQLVDGFKNATSSVATRLDAAQVALVAIDEMRTSLSEQAMLLTAQSIDVQVEAVVSQAHEAFLHIVASLNTGQAGRSLFSGTATDKAALQPGAAILDEIRTALAQVPEGEARRQALDDWFNDPNGGFVQWAYNGAQENFSQQINSGQKAQMPVRADDPILRSLLQSTAQIALSSFVAGDDLARDVVIEQGSSKLMELADGMVALQTSVGIIQSEVERVQAGFAAERTALVITERQLSEVDVFEAANALQVISDQLEIQYSMTARLSRLSLVNYL